MTRRRGLAELVLERSRAFTERRAHRPKADTGPNRNRTLSLFSTGRRQPRSPDRRRSLLRRQDMVRGQSSARLAFSHLLTECERAVAEVIARRHIGWGFCDLMLGRNRHAGGCKRAHRAASPAAARSAGMGDDHRARPLPPTQPDQRGADRLGRVDRLAFQASQGGTFWQGEGG